MQPLMLHHAGDPSKSTEDLPPGSLTWTLSCDDEYIVTAFQQPAHRPCWGYRVREADRWVSLVLAALQFHLSPSVTHLCYSYMLWPKAGSYAVLEAVNTIVAAALLLLLLLSVGGCQASPGSLPCMQHA